MPAPGKVQTLTVRSTAGEDGYVARFLAWGDSSGRVRVGDPGMFNTDMYRGLLSFDLSGLPQGARIQSATLRLYRASATGNVGLIQVDLEPSTIGGAGIERSDYSSRLAGHDVARFGVPDRDDAAVEASLSAHGQSLLEGATVAQLRLVGLSRATFEKNQVEFHGGEHPSEAPELVITFTR